jgi:hypothetical protein
MNHIEPDDLATLALDRVAPEGVTRAHLDECAECRTEYEALARTVALGQGAPDDELEPPPSSVWAAIHGELALAPELAPDPFGPGEVRTAVTATVTEPVGPPPKEGATAIAAASVGLVAGIAVGAGLAGLGGDEPAPQTVVADATLDPFPGWSATGSALVEEDDAGVRSIVVNLDAEVPATDVREVWLIRSDASGLVSLGLLEGTSGRFVVPAGIDLDEFTLVDVSAEPVDGDPAHSGDSIVRGELQRT